MASRAQRSLSTRFALSGEPTEMDLGIMAFAARYTLEIDPPLVLSEGWVSNRRSRRAGRLYLQLAERRLRPIPRAMDATVT